MHNAKQAEKEERLRRQTEIALPKIRDYYQIGLALVNDWPLNERLKLIFARLNKDTKTKIKRFPRTEKNKVGYSEQQLNELLEHCTRESFPVGFKLIERLLSIRPPIIKWLQVRQRLQRQMINGGWRRRELDRQIALIRTENTWNRGTVLHELPTAEGVIPELWRMSKEWGERACDINTNHRIVLKQLKKGDRKRFSEATTILQELKQSLDKVLRKEQPRIAKDKAPVPTPKGRQ